MGLPCGGWRRWRCGGCVDPVGALLQLRELQGAAGYVFRAEQHLVGPLAAGTVNFWLRRALRDASVKVGRACIFAHLTPFTWRLTGFTCAHCSLGCARVCGRRTRPPPLRIRALYVCAPCSLSCARVRSMQAHSPQHGRDRQQREALQQRPPPPKACLPMTMPGSVWLQAWSPMCALSHPFIRFVGACSGRVRLVGVWSGCVQHKGCRALRKGGPCSLVSCGTRSVYVVPILLPPVANRLGDCTWLTGLQQLHVY